MCCVLVGLSLFNIKVEISEVCCIVYWSIVIFLGIDFYKIYIVIVYFV